MWTKFQPPYVGWSLNANLNFAQMFVQFACEQKIIGQLKIKSGLNL